MYKILLPLLFAAFAAEAQPGILDYTFGTNGRVFETFKVNNQAASIEVLPDNKFLVLAMVNDMSATAYPIVLKYLPDGAPDPAFGYNGVAMPTDTISNLAAFDLAVQPDQKILVAGAKWNPALGHHDFLVFRFLANGMMDTTFGNAGYAVVDMDSTADMVFNIAVQPDGKILLAGQVMYTYITLTPIYGIARFLGDGTIDTSFGDQGKKLIVPQYGAGFCGHVALTANNRIILGGRIPMPGNDNDIGLICLDMDGDIDSNFGTNGIFYTDHNGQDDWISSMIPATDGGVIVLGHSSDTASGKVLVYKVTAAGMLDQAWGGGYQLISNGLPFNEGGKIRRDKNGDYIASAVFDNNGQLNSYLFKLSAVGTFQSNFGNAGFAKIPASTFAPFLAIQQGNKILAAGCTRIQVNPVKIATLRFGNAPSASVAPVQALTEMHAYPNPASHSLHVVIAPGNMPGNLRLVDIRGVVIKEIATGRQSAYNIDLGDMAPGTYWIQYISAGAVAIKMITIVQ